jgi:hypothetical protein
MGALSNILVSPSEAYEQITNRPRWILPMLVCMITMFGVIWLGVNWPNVPDGLTWPRLLGPALISPLIVAIVSVGSSLFLYLVDIIAGGRGGEAPGFRKILSLNLHCAVVILLGEVVNLLLVRSNVLGDIEFPLSNRFPVGLDILLLTLPNPGVYTAILLHSTSAFVLWYLVVLGRGLAVLTGSSILRSTVIAASLWCAAVIIVLGLAYAAGGGTTIRITMQ